MYRDRDLDPRSPLPQHEAALREDLDLDTLVQAMAGRDPFLSDVARRIVLAGPRNDLDTILYRQAIVEDCLRNGEVVRELYALSLEAIESKKEHFLSFFARHPASLLYGSVGTVRTFVGMLRKFRSVADVHGHRFVSEGFTAFFAMIEAELTDEYFTRVEVHLDALNLTDGVLLSAELGEGNDGANYLLHLARHEKPRLLQRLLGKRTPGYTFRIHEQDEAGARILSELRDRGLNLVANALAQSTDHILGFFELLRTELAFYVACLNLYAVLVSLDVPVSMPRPQTDGGRACRFRELCDPSLALSLRRGVVGNTVDADGTNLVIITGANQGGKSTFLRSVGVAQLMMQAGMFVAAESFEAELCTDLFTHFRREEDAAMESGKLDEEFDRMSEIVDGLSPGAMVLFNESFASTNEREGSEIARQVTRALVEAHVRVFFVTHLHAFARSLFDRRMDGTLFLRADRSDDGTRTFLLSAGEPLETSYGQDLYQEVFGVGGEEVEAAG